MKVLILLITPLITSTVWAAPSGVRPLPSDVRIPTSSSGRSLPVTLYADDQSDHLIHVVPNEGHFRGMGAVRNVITDCGAVKIDMGVRREISKMRSRALVRLKRAADEREAVQRRLGEATEAAAQLSALLTVKQNQLRQEKALHDQKKTNIDQQRDAIRQLKIDVREAVDEEERKLAQAALDEAHAIYKKDQREFKRGILRAYTKVKNEVQRLEVAHAAAQGEVTGIEGRLEVFDADFTKITAQVAQIDQQLDQAIAKYGNMVGGYINFTADFGPSEYLRQLKDHNPQEYQFRYVSTATARVVPTLTGELKPQSNVSKNIGEMILGASYTDPASPEMRRPFKRDIEIDPTNKDLVRSMQAYLAMSEGSLTGTKDLLLKMSVLGYCGLREPSLFSDEVVGGAADVFKLNMHFTYPVAYGIDVTGRYNRTKILYQMHKETKSSSWFGLKRKEKVEKLQRFTHDEYMKVDVNLRSPQFTAEDALAMSQAVKTQLLAMLVSDQMDFKHAASTPLQVVKPGELGSSRVARRLSSIPHPWAYWGGFVLSSLGDLFGSSTGESIQEQIARSTIRLDERLRFNFMHSGSISVGNVRDVEETIRN